MRRALVLTNEAARHPFRASLPQRRSAFADVSASGGGGWQVTRDDMRGVATTYFATVAAVLAYIV